LAIAVRTGVTVLDFRHVALHSLFDKALESNIFNAKLMKIVAEIEVSVEINAPIDKVWDIISDIDNEPKFWKGTKEVKNMSKNGNTVNREITIAFRDQKCLQEVKIYPKDRVEAVFTKGIIDGIKIITIATKNEKTILKTKWDIKLTGIMGMFTGMIKKHIESGTEQALQKIKEEAEQ